MYLVLKTSLLFIMKDTIYSSYTCCYHLHHRFESITSTVVFSIYLNYSCTTYKHVQYNKAQPGSCYTCYYPLYVHYGCKA